MNVSEIISIISDLFDQGYGSGSVKLLIPNDRITMDMSKSHSGYEILFSQSLPAVKVKKFIEVSLSIEGITIRNDEIWFRIKNFPDVPMSYFTSNPDNYTEVFTYDLEKLIEEKYGSSKAHKKIATLCLQHAKEWATITSQAVCLSDMNQAERKECRKLCHNFVVEQVKKDIEKEYGSAILTYLLIMIIIPAVARFIIERLLNKYF